MYKVLAKYLIYYPIQYARKQKIWKFINDVDKYQHLSYEKIKELKTEKLIDLINHIYEHIPYYRKKLDQLDLTPGSFTSLKDINKLPVMRKSGA